MHIVVGSSTLTSTATFNGGGSTALFGVGAADTTVIWAALSAGTGGSSPLPESSTFTGVAGTRYSPALVQNSDNTVGYYVVANTLTNFPAVGDNFNTFSGVCPECQWYGQKIFKNDGSGGSDSMSAALDDIVVNRVMYNIKIANMSVGTVTDTPVDSKDRLFHSFPESSMFRTHTLQ